MSTTATPSIPSIPSDASAQMRAFLQAVKDTLEVREGRRSNSSTERNVTKAEINSVLSVSDISKVTLDTSALVSSTTVPESPHDLVVENKTFCNLLTWTNPTDTSVSHIEVWCAVYGQYRDDAKRIGIVTVTDALRGEKGTFSHTALDIRQSYTYWIRSISWSGNYSSWSPSDAQGGYVVAASIGSSITEVMAGMTGDGADGLPFVTGEIDGVESVGLSGNMVIDGSILTRMLAAGLVTADKVSATDVFTMNLQSGNYSSVSSGFKLDAINGTAEFNNIVITINSLKQSAGWSELPESGADVTDYDAIASAYQAYADAVAEAEQVRADAYADGIVTEAEANAIAEAQTKADAAQAAAEATASADATTKANAAAKTATNWAADSDTSVFDGGKIYAGSSIQVGNLDGYSDYCKIDSGDIIFYYYFGGSHREYKSLKRIETGTALSGQVVTIPGYWNSIPRIMISPAILDIYNSNYSNQSQKISCQVENLTEDSAGVWSFTPKASLILSSGETSTDINITFSDSVTGAVLSNTWTTVTKTTPLNVASITVNTSYSLYSREGFLRAFGFCGTREGIISITIYVYIDGTQYTLYSYSGTGSASTDISKTYNVTAGAHTIYLKAVVYAVGTSATKSGDNGCTSVGHASASFSWLSYSTNISADTVLANGTLNWIATGE